MVDEELIGQVKKNDKAAFKSLYESYADKIFKTAYMLINDSGYAQDIVQEVFIKIYVNINTLKHNSAFNSWIYSITVNCSMKYIKDNSKLKLLLDDESIDNIPEEKAYLIPEDSYMQKELCSEIMTYLYELPKLQRIALILYYYNRFSIKEIANVMDCPEGTVKARLFRAKKNLKILLDYKNKNEVNMYGFRTIN